MKTLENILAILVLYNCRIEESETYCSLNESLVHFDTSLNILIYDNSPVKTYTATNFTKDRMHITYISDLQNSGVSHAYNTGWKLAEEMGKKWILLLDQDTSFPIHSIKIYGEQIEKQRSICSPILSMENGLLSSPCTYKWGRGCPLKKMEPGDLNLYHKSILNSGLLIHVDVMKKTKGYNENIPLDFSDHEWMERVRQHYKTIYVMDLVCKHSLSATETDVKKVLNRFKYYLAGAKEYQKHKAPVGLLFVVFLRTIKLSLRFRTFDFLRYYLHH